MVRGCPLLEDVQFSEIELTNTLLPTLGACCPLLKRVFLRSVSFSDDDMTALCQGCPGLLSLRLPKCQDIGAAMVTIASHCKKLQELMLTDNEKITDQSLCALFASCTDLRSVYLGRLMQLTSSSVLALLHNCPLLQSLSLDCEYSLIHCKLNSCTDKSEIAELIRSKAITYETLDHIPICCKGLKVLHLSHCHFICEGGVWALIDECKGLAELTVKYCQQAKPSPECKEKIKEIGKRYRGLEVEWD